MLKSPIARRRIIDLARMSLGIGDELGNRLGRKRWINLKDFRHADEACNRCDVADEIEVELFIKRRVDRGRRSEEEERVTARGRMHPRVCANIGTGSWLVFNDKWLAQPI